MEGLKDFVERLCKDVGFYYHLCERVHQYSLKKYNNKPKQMGVFGWVRELKRRGQFEITIYKITGDALKMTKYADETKEGSIYLSKDDDPEGKSKALIFYVDRESSGEDYQKSVKALKAIMDKMIVC